MSGSSSPPATAPDRDLVLVGAGHAHVQVLRRWMMKSLDDVRLTLVVDRHEAVYSGMVPGLVAGDYTPHELTIDALPLARRAGARCLHAAAVRIDPVARAIELEGRPPVRYDVASLDVGSSVRDLDLPGIAKHVVATRPIGRFVERIEECLATAASNPARPLRVVVVGGGAAGIELSLCVDARLRAGGRAAEVTLLAASSVLLPGGHAQLDAPLRRHAEARGVRIELGRRAVGAEADAVLVACDEGEPTRWPADLILWATGAAPPALLGRSALPLDDAGFVRVDRELRVTGLPDLFAAGDCARPDDAPWVPRAGVYAVRQGPVLDHNLRAALTARRLRPYRPQRDFLALINLGGGRAIGGKWGLRASGTAVFGLKDWIDRRFMARFQVLAEDGRPAPHFPSPEEMAGDDEEMACGGCAAKVGPSPLRAALERLAPAAPDESVLLGMDAADDAAAFRLPRGDVVLATVDAFRAFVDDPWLVGRVAAVNAVSDVLAKGGRPRHALALVTVPEGTPGQSAEALYQVLSGVRAALDPLGVSLVGGHSTTGQELFVGLSITGDPADDGGRLLRIDGLAPGELLVLSKPLGSGVLLAADMRGLAPARWVVPLTAALQRDNAGAAAAASRHGASACTDVSGFGLAGHLIEMLDASDAEAELYATRIRAFDGALQLFGDGLQSTYHDQNASLRVRIHATDGVPDTLLDLLFDPQTAGGLLIGIAADRAPALLASLHEAGDTEAAVIGVVEGPGTGAAPLRIARGEPQGFASSSAASA